MASLSDVSGDRVDFEKLSTAERIRVLQDLWDEIAADSDAVPLTDAQRAELDRRLEEHRANPADGAEWSEVKARLRSR
jgi:putative addiction module component (TIGR02574 family)